MSLFNTANGGLFVVSGIPNTVGLLWTLYALHSFNPHNNTAKIWEEANMH